MTKQVAIITGAGSGLGKALVNKLAKLNYHICLLGRNKEKLTTVAANIMKHSSIYPVDVSDKPAVDHVVATIIKEHGSIDLLINNAGVGIFELTENIDEESVHQMIDINLKGTIFCTQAVLPRMKRRNEGTIVNIVSTAGVEGKATESVYCASKFGVRGFTESLQHEINETDIRLNAIYMGGMNTEFWDGILPTEVTEGLMHPDDIADIIIANITLRNHINVSDIVIRNKKN